MNDTPPERSLSMLLSQGLLLAMVIYSSVAMADILLNGTSNPIGSILYASLLLVLPLISLVAFFKKSTLTHKLPIISLACIWGWILRVLWIWSGSAPASIWEMSFFFQAIFFLLATLSLGIPALAAKLEFERRSTAITSDFSENSSANNLYLINSSASFDDGFFWREDQSVRKPN